MSSQLTKVEALDDFEYKGAPIKKGYIIWVHANDLGRLKEAMKVRILRIPENRTYK